MLQHPLLNPDQLAADVVRLQSEHAALEAELVEAQESGDSEKLAQLTEQMKVMEDEKGALQKELAEAKSALQKELDEAEARLVEAKESGDAAASDQIMVQMLKMQSQMTAMQVCVEPGGCTCVPRPLQSQQHADHR